MKTHGKPMENLWKPMEDLWKMLGTLGVEGGFLVEWIVFWFTIEKEQIGFGLECAAGG